MSCRRHSELVAASFACFLATRCNIYNPSLLERGAANGGDVGTAGQLGASGTSGGGEDAGANDGAAAGEQSGGASGGGAGGRAETAGTTEAGGARAHGGGGNANGGGGTSSAGRAGAAGSSADGGSGGAGASAGSGGAPVETANGCAKLSVPLTATGDKAHFVLALTSPADLSNATLSMRVYVKAGTGGTLFNYVQDSGTYHFLGVPSADRRLLSSFNGWTTLSWDVGAEPPASTNIVKTSIKSIGIELNAQPSSAWSNPTIVYVDSINVTTPALSFSFDMSSTVSTGSSATGQALWLNSGSSDTTATGAAISWQASCP